MRNPQDEMKLTEKISVAFLLELHIVAAEKGKIQMRYSRHRYAVTMKVR